MPGFKWTELELTRLYSHPHERYEEWRSATGSTRTYHGWRMKRGDMQLARDASPIPRIVSDTAREPELNWRDWNAPIKTLQALRKQAKGSSDEHAIAIEADAPVAFIVLGDTHIGAWSTDHELFERITDEILGIPNLFVALMGDMAHMAIKLRGVTEVGDNLLPADLQLLYLQSWLLEIQDRVLFATWGNHEVERVESQAGLNPFGDLYRKTARHYFNGIGHVDLIVNGIEYRIAASHHFRGRSIYSPVHGTQRYITLEASDRDIAIAGDSHVPGILDFTYGKDKKLCVNCGSMQSWSGYSQRYFSLFTHPTFPVVVLDHEEKDFRAYWSIKQYLRATTAQPSNAP